MPRTAIDLQNAVRARLLEKTALVGTLNEEDIARVIREVSPLVGADLLHSMTREIYADIDGIGPLQQFLADDDITDVMAVAKRGVWVERSGVLERTPLDLSETQIRQIIERIVGPLGLRIDRASPMVDARLADGSRVNAIAPPLAIDGPCLTIRKFAMRQIPLTCIAAPHLIPLLTQFVAMRCNIIVSGGTGAGKTTLLNALSGYIDERERVVTIEDTAELRLQQRHIVRLEARPANSEGVGCITIRDLVRNALRMRPDRIIVGEVRGAEALDMIQAMNTGHEGSLSTCHANSCGDALHRIETMMLMSDVSLPISAVRRQIASAVDFIVQIRRSKTGKREVVEIAEVQLLEDTIIATSIANATTLLKQPCRPRALGAVS